MKRARLAPLRGICVPKCAQPCTLRMLSSTGAARSATPHEPHPPATQRPQTSASHEQQASRFRWTRERASTADHGEGDGSFSGQGSMIDTALGIALGTAMLGCGGIAYFSWYVAIWSGHYLGIVITVTYKRTQVQVERTSEDGYCLPR